MSPAARLAAALASRLAPVVPPGVAVSATGSAVSVTVEGAWASTKELAGIVGQPGDVVEHVCTAAWAVLSGVQDDIVRTTAERWPMPDVGGLPLPWPQVVVEGGEVALRYGDAAAPVLELEPISLDELALPDD